MTVNLLVLTCNIYLQSQIERKLTERGAQYLVGSRISWADIHLFYFCSDEFMEPEVKTNQGLYIGYDSISVLSQSVSLLQVYLLLELSSSSLLAGTGGNRRRPAATSPLVFSVVQLGPITL